MVSSLNRVFGIFSAALISLGLANGSCDAKPLPHIRVAIVQDAFSLSLKVSGGYRVIDLLRQETVYRGENLSTTVTAYKKGILLGERIVETSKVAIVTDDGAGITVDGRAFRDGIRLISKENAHLLVINDVNLEDYVKGILYHEVSHYWPDEVLKAQAIVCRTYALYQAEENRLRDYDLTSDVYSQVYGGQTSERYRTNKMVDATKTEVLTFNGKILPAYYHATCGGHTEDAAALWNINIPPLKGVPCGFCKASPHLKWHAVLSLDEISQKLTAAGFSECRLIKGIVINGRDNSGRVTDLTVSAAGGEIKIPAKEFRNAISPNIIRSTDFSLNIVVSDAIFEGTGWGHGVGMCQWGAYFMAKQGYNYKDILKYYYPGSQLSGI